ncbi:hypothetical protein BDW59DRAFT_167774 [Aspergillus cavernicola]|uniref:ubiquitinyl hydrolase 1 n=1 Tax=Aspergillus cavernicola TaxID=176166 RepID=A0ABR4HAS2_9EURO
MKVSKHTFKFLFHHVVFPPMLPQDSDEDEVDMEWRLERRLHQFVLEQLESFIEESPPSSKGLWEIVSNMLGRWMEVDKQGTICKDTLARMIAELKVHGAAALYIRAQNCGFIAYHDKDRSRLVVDAFEVSPRSADVVSAPGSLHRRFPGSSVTVPAEKVEDPAFCAWLAASLSDLYTEGVEEMIPKTVKAKVPVLEERDTVHPGMVTECLMTQLLAFGEHNTWPVFDKHMRDEVNWRNSRLPWRRSPHWFVIRVAMQTVLQRLFPDSDGRKQYKNFMLYLVAKLGLVTVTMQPDIPADCLHMIRAKIGRRLYKLQGGVYGHVAEQARLSNVTIMAKLQKVQETIIKLDQRTIPNVFNPTKDNLRMSLKGCGAQLRAAMVAVPGEVHRTQFNREYDQRLKRNKHGLPMLRQNDPLSLADFEGWVETMLTDWLRDQEASELLCRLLAEIFQKYSEFAAQTYEGCPDMLSIMVLTMLELWVTMDKMCTSIDPRLQHYSPEIPEDFLEPLLLPQIEQMQRAKRVEGYVRIRYQNHDHRLPGIFDDPAPGSFAIIYFDHSDGLKKRRGQIEEHAKCELQDKQREWERKSDQYHRLLSRSKGLLHEWPYDRFGTEYHTSACERCALENEASSMRIEIYEWPLPKDENNLKSVIFELDCPSWFTAWRDLTWRLMHDFGRQPSTKASKMEQNLLNYKETIRFAVQWGQRLTLGSTTKSWKRTHYNDHRFPVEFKVLSLPNAFQFRLLDSKENSWVVDQDNKPTVKPRCTFAVPEGPYSQLQYAVDSFYHTENEVIADQKKCPTKVSLHEFVAFGCLRAGERIQWHNIVRELASATLSMNEEAVSVLFRQAAWELGTPRPGTDLREAHRVFEDIIFVDRLLETLEQKLLSIQANWNEYHTLHTLVTLGLRCLSLSAVLPTSQRTVEFLRRSREVAMEWCENLIETLDDKTGTQSEAHQLLIVRIGTICQLTYDVEIRHLSSILHSGEDLFHLVRSSIVVSENAPRSLESVSTEIRLGLIRTARILRHLENRTREVIIRDASGLNNAIRESARNLQISLPWEFCPGNAARWATNKTDRTSLGRQQVVHYNLLNGELLVDNRPPGRLPKEYTEDPLFRRTFGARTLNVVPSNLAGSTFMSTRHFENFQVHFGMEDSQLVVKAQEDDRILRLVPHETLYGDFPDSLASNHIHWLDLKNGILEFRPLQQAWQRCARNWHLSLSSPDAETATMTQGCRKMVDTHSHLFRQLAAVLNTLDASPHIMVTENESGILEVEMVRMRLNFFVNSKGALESRELNATVDYDQDIGCFYGLEKKLVLRHPDPQDSRSVLIPYGSVELRKKKHHPIISIHPPDEARVIYFQYSLDPILRILRGPLDMMGTLYQAYIHAVTAFVLPDPATERSGTEEALRILRQAWLKTSFPLSPECCRLLEYIAALTPKRQFYPNHLKTMQTVTWNSELGELAQHDEFRVLVKQIVDHANSFSCFHGVQGEQQEAAIDCYRKRGDQHLLERARYRHSHFHRTVVEESEVCSSPRASRYSARDGDIQSDRSRRVFEVAALVCSWPSSVPYCEELFGTIEEWEYVRTAGPSIQDYTCTDLLQLSFRDAWGTLYELCRSTDRSQDSYSLMSLFCMIAFGRESQLLHIRPLLAIAFTGGFKDLSVPENQNPDRVLHLCSGQEVVGSDIQRAIEPYYTPFQSLYIGRGRNPSASDIENHRLQYQLKKENDINECVNTIANQWPEDGPRLPEKVRIDDHLQASKSCARLWTCWYQNREFLKFLRQVQDRLNGMGTIDPVNWSVPPPPAKEPDLPLADTPFRPPDLFDMLRVCNPISAPKSAPPLRFRRLYASQYYSTGENSELRTVILDLCNEPNRHRRELGIGLQDSLDALDKTELPCHSASLPEVRDVIVQCGKRLTEQQDHLWNKIHTALTTTGKFWQQVSGPIVWPRVTVFSVLSLLAIDQWQHVPDGWKSTLLALAKIITSLRRSKRLLALCDRGDFDAFFKESETISGDGWNPEDSSEWLLFEIECNLTIREPQAEVAKKIIGSGSSDNAVLQLNMGEGKTAVITPIAALTLADCTQLLRIIVLKPLLKQSVNILSQLGSMLNRPVYYIPFSRDTPLDDAMVEKLGQIYQDCRARRGILIALPEHILSYRLVGLDLTGRSSDLAPKVIRLETWLQDNCRNIIDESDEVLDPKFQLIFTIGHQQTMDGHSDRWEVTQSLLTLVEKKAIELRDQDPDYLDIEQNGTRYPIFHFLKAEAVDRLVEKVLRAIDDEGLPGIPFHQWTQQVRRRAMHFIRFADTTDSDECLLRNALEGGVSLRKLLVLRGLLVQHILKFALANKRWLVDYGLHPSRCMMAVPFRAKGIPSENAEFGHPDVAITLTCLSYYYHGLTQEQVRHCFNLLLKENDPSVEYRVWIAREPSTLPVGLRQITGVNLEDIRAFEELLYPHIQYQKGIIDFYLSRVVFPREAKEFPHKLCTSAWDLPSREDQPLTTGFSGTNDNRFLLPKTAPQRDLPHLLHTNAMVLTYLLREESRQCVLADDEQGRPLRARELVGLINKQDPPIRVIIDVGAQILEYSNRSVAEQWLSMSPTADGAIFYDESDEAIVVNRKGDLERLFASPFRHRMDSCLVYGGVHQKFPPR